jgi:hypothetical protein
MTGWVRVPIGEHAEWVRTIPFERTVLIVARTAGTVSWLLDFLPEILSDPRVQILFTVEDEDTSSVFHQGARSVLQNAEVAVIPWRQAIETEFDLAVCSTHSASTQNLRSRLLITLHGAGFGKLTTIRSGGALPLPQDPSGNLALSRLPKTTVALSHPEQVSLFPDFGPEVRMLVTGDPAYDRLLASLPFRQQYRSAFELVGSQRLIVLSSTWAPNSQFASYPELALRLSSELPVDEYRIAMILHPNIWTGHSPWQLRTWLKDARQAGVTIVPPNDHSWRGSVVAADALIADHGSVAFYAAAIGIPILKLAFSIGELIKDSPIARLGCIAPSFEPHEDYRTQLEEAIQTHNPMRYRAEVDRMFAEAGRCLVITQQAIYELLNLAPPTRIPRTLPVSPPSVTIEHASSHLVRATVESALRRSSPLVTIERFPAREPRPQSSRASAAPPANGPPRDFSYIASNAMEQDSTLIHEAAVVFRYTKDRVSPSAQEQWVADTFVTLPNSQLLASGPRYGDRAMLFLRQGTWVKARVLTPDGGPADDLDLAVLASAVYVWISARGSRPLRRSRFVLAMGRRRRVIETKRLVGRGSRLRLGINLHN